MRNSSSLDWLRFMHTPNDYRVSRFLSKPTQHFLFKPIQQLVFIGFRPNYSPTSIHTQTQTYLSLHPHTENPQNW